MGCAISPESVYSAWFYFAENSYVHFLWISIHAILNVDVNTFVMIGVIRIMAAHVFFFSRRFGVDAKVLPQ